MDSRVRGVRVSLKGAQRVARARREVGVASAAAVTGLSADEVRELERLLGVVARNLADVRERRGLRRR